MTYKLCNWHNMNKVKKIEFWETWTNLAYNLAGFLAYYFHQDLLICFALQALGVGSFIYHRDKSSDRLNNTIWLFDWWSMSFLLSIVVGSYWDNQTVWLLVIAYQVVYSYFIMGRFSVYLEVAFISVPVMVSRFLIYDVPSSFFVLGLFVFAILVRSQDSDTRQLTYHDSPYHATWHVLTAIGFYLAMYL